MTYSQLMALAEQLHFCAHNSCLDCPLVEDDSKCIVKNLDEIAEIVEFLANLIAEGDEEWEVTDILPF